MTFAWHGLSKLLSGVAVSLLFQALAIAAPPLHIAAAADLASCIAELNEGFAKTVGGAEVRTSTGSSGNFFAQIKNGAPFDVFLSADMDYPRELAKGRFADPSTLEVYAHGQLLMWTVNPALDLNAGLNLLSDPKVRHIAIANPEVAPYGRAARAVLQQAGVWDSVKAKLVFGENVAQAAHFVDTGNAEVGFVGIAHVKSSKNPSGRAWPVPAALQPLMEQGAIVTTKGSGNPLSLKYMDYLRTDGGRAILRKCGFALPEKPIVKPVERHP
ncbi:molybdate ABC transporter substrate-binding protein [soil metagenome]